MSVLNIGLAFLFLFLTSANCDIYGDKVERKVSQSSLCYAWPYLNTSSLLISFQLNLTLNPGCPDEICRGENKGRVTVVHITADSKTDRLHNVWSFARKPSVLIARSSLNSNLTIDWDRFASSNNLNSVVIDPEPTESFVLVVNRVSCWLHCSWSVWINEWIIVTDSSVQRYTRQRVSEFKCAYG